LRARLFVGIAATVAVSAIVMLADREPKAQEPSQNAQA